eukprot:Phypoly_transcript_02440.p1 GENE.Phypoly_transcript_02440~~Phypoly_transcript_02440.p1  ORF type:complete len:307 (+),score=76.39 Phypoly_transcript_02440:1708-2628(+)
MDDESYKKQRSKLAFKKEEVQPAEPELPGFLKAGAGRGTSAYERHKKFINDYVIFYGRESEYLQPTKPHKTDYDVLREEYRFLRTDEDNDDSQFEKRLAKKYYDKLFKEYCLADLSRYKHGQIGLRWRTEKEVFTGKGQFVCGNKKCDERNNLNSYELPFAYTEAGENKNALVKLRACPACAEMVTYYHNKKNHKNDLKHVKKEAIEGGDRGEALRITEGEDEKGEGEKREGEKGEGGKGEGSNKRQAEKKVKEEPGGKRQRRSEEERTEEEDAESRAAANPWKAKAQVEKTKDEEFEEYFEGLFP